MSLVDDFRQQRELKQAAAVQARDRVAAWQPAVATLCKRIEQLLDDSIKGGFIKPEADTVHLRDKITQEQYQIDRLKLRTDGHTVVILSPVRATPPGTTGAWIWHWKAEGQAVRPDLGPAPRGVGRRAMAARTDRFRWARLARGILYRRTRLRKPCATYSASTGRFSE